jgi:IS5 family transposase
METQLTLAMMNDELGQARTSKKEFLDKIERIIPWDTFIGIIEPCYYKGERGNKPYPLELMLRIFLLQNLYDLADMRVMTEVIDSRAFSEFCGVTSPDEVPDGDTIGRFRNLLEKNGIQEKIFAEVVKILEERALILKKEQLWIPHLLKHHHLQRIRGKNVIRKRIPRKKAIHGTSDTRHISV